MEKFNLENLLCTLFSLGFNQIDSIFYNLVLDKISTDQDGKKQFKFINSDFTRQFKDFVVSDELGYKLKEGFTLESNIKSSNEMESLLNQFLCDNAINRKLREYFNTFDFRDIIIHKINLIGVDRIDKLSNKFSNKEKEIINEMQREEEQKYIAAYSRIYDQESKDIEATVKRLSKTKMNCN